jgi:hypothetical protein
LFLVTVMMAAAGMVPMAMVPVMIHRLCNSAAERARHDGDN